jgi:hypothetical protein
VQRFLQQPGVKGNRADMKGSYKLRQLGDVTEIIRSAPSIRAAAKRLGVNPSSVCRWIAEGKVAGPVSQRPVRPVPSLRGRSPDAWRRWVRRRYELDGTDQVLLGLAVKAYKIADDPKSPSAIALAAMGRFAQLTKQLNLEVAIDG